MNFYELQNLCFKSVLLNGDALVMLPMRRTRNFPYDLRVALIEGDRLQDPPLRTYNMMLDGGVEFDLDGKPVAYHITNRHPLTEREQAAGMSFTYCRSEESASTEEYRSLRQ